MKLAQVDIFSDGGANPNPGPGGYGVIMKCGEHQKDFSQGYKRTTNNRMELMGAIVGFQKLKTKSRVTLNTDSQYTINGLQKGWAQKWRANNWIKPDKKKAQNWDLWEILLAEYEKHEVSFNWIKGHNGHIENELCDQLASLAMQRDDLLVDVGFIEDQPSLNSPALIQFSTPGHPSLEQSSIHLDPKGRNEAAKKSSSVFELSGTNCRKCQNPLVIKYPKHSKKTLEKQYYYEYYHHCESCKTNYMLEQAKRDIKTLKI